MLSVVELIAALEEFITAHIRQDHRGSLPSLLTSLRKANEANIHGTSTWRKVRLDLDAIRLTLRYRGLENELPDTVIQALDYGGCTRRPESA